MRFDQDGIKIAALKRSLAQIAHLANPLRAGRIAGAGDHAEQGLAYRTDADKMQDASLHAGDAVSEYHSR